MRRNENNVSTVLQRIGELAERDHSMKFTSLAHILNKDMLKSSFKKLNQRGAPGIDGVRMKEYKEKIDENIFELYEELKSGKYRASSVRRLYIPKANGKMRPLGVPTVKDRIVQRAVGEIISRIYEPYFIDNSFGFRPGRSCHDALKKLKQSSRSKRSNYIVEADIKSYFDTVNHEWMMKFLGHRIADKQLLRIVKKWLKAGHMENGVVCRDEEGTPQGGPISPLLANIYLHYVLDLWFEKKFAKSCKGKTVLIRYADDFVVCFENKEEAERFLKELAVRFKSFNLELSGEKTRLLEFGKQSKQNGTKGKGDDPKTFDFLGFTVYMRGNQRGKFTTAFKPSRKSKNKFLQAVKDWLRDNINRNVWYQAYSLRRKLIGYYNYFGLRYCLQSLWHIKHHVVRLWVMVLRRRSQRHKMWWKVFLAKPWYRILPKPILR
jgi:RNA-directed DNA polymerase